MKTLRIADSPRMTIAHQCDGQRMGVMATIADSPVDYSEKAQRTVAQIKSALEGGKSASIAQIVELIREVTYKFESVSVQQLGEAVGRDLLTMSRVISVAHTLGYNPEGVEISTINQAIHVIGFNKIRNLALSLMLMENATNGSAGDKRDVAASALAIGLIAQVIRGRNGSRDAEEAFVCTTLRNYGRIMLANFLPEPFQNAVRRTSRDGEASAFREEFGLTPLELSAELLGQSRMPGSLVQSLREVTPAVRNSPNLTDVQELSVLATFADELCQLLDQPSLTIDNFTDRALGLAQSFGSNISLDEEELFDVLNEVSATLSTFGALQADSALNCPLLNRLRALAAKSEPASIRPQIETDTEGLASDSDARVPQYENALAEGIAAIMALEREVDVSLDAVHEVALTAVHKRCEFCQTIIFRRSESVDRFFAWKGKGDFFSMIRGEELLNSSVRDVFSVCLRRGEDVLIQNPSDPRIQSFIPDWLRPVAGAQPLVLLPIVDQSGTVVVLCGMRNSDDHYELSAKCSQQLCSLRKRISAIEERCAGQSVNG